MAASIFNPRSRFCSGPPTAAGGLRPAAGEGGEAGGRRLSSAAVGPVAVYSPQGRLRGRSLIAKRQVTPSKQLIHQRPRSDGDGTHREVEDSESRVTRSKRQTSYYSAWVGRGAGTTQGPGLLLRGHATRRRLSKPMWGCGSAVCSLQEAILPPTLSHTDTATLGHTHGHTHTLKHT